MFVLLSLISTQSSLSRQVLEDGVVDDKINESGGDEGTRGKRGGRRSRSESGSGNKRSFTATRTYVWPTLDAEPTTSGKANKSVDVDESMFERMLLMGILEARLIVV